MQHVVAVTGVLEFQQFEVFLVQNLYRYRVHFYLLMCEEGGKFLMQSCSCTYF